MDKRWILIIIILLVGISALYFSAIESNGVGNAVTTIQNVVVTVPAEDMIGRTTDTSLELVGRENNETMNITLIREKDVAFDLMQSDLKNIKKSNALNVENDTQDFNGKIGYVIKYQEIKEDTTLNHTVAYVNKLNKAFIIDSYGYDDADKQVKDLTYIIDTLKLDFKVSDY